MNLTIAGGTVHTLPVDLKKMLQADKDALAAWRDITPLARNEWICWVDRRKVDRNTTATYRARPDGTCRGHATTLLLAGLYPPQTIKSDSGLSIRLSSKYAFITD